VSLFEEVHACDRCSSARFGFTRLAEDHGYFKFPPTIGAIGEAPLLFMGINPRIDDGNRGLYTDAMASSATFSMLASNRVPRKGVSAGKYIRSSGGEGHYRLHTRLVEAAFWPGAQFEDHAAVTELFYCATKDSTGVQRAVVEGNFQCAALYFARVLAQVKPLVVVAVGVPPAKYLRTQRIDGTDDCYRIRVGSHEAWVVELPHPAAFTSAARRQQSFDNAVSVIKRVRAENANPATQAPAPSEQTSHAGMRSAEGDRSSLDSGVRRPALSVRAPWARSLRPSTKMWIIVASVWGVWSGIMNSVTSGNGVPTGADATISTIGFVLMIPLIFITFVCWIERSPFRLLGRINASSSAEELRAWETRPHRDRQGESAHLTYATYPVEWNGRVAVQILSYQPGMCDERAALHVSLVEQRSLPADADTAEAASFKVTMDARAAELEAQAHDRRLQKQGLRPADILAAEQAEAKRQGAAATVQALKHWRK
jgi:hypothetical protein